MKENKDHILGAAVILIFFLVAIMWESSLTKDAPTTLGTVGFFGTAYGVLFAIIELRRSKAASTLARDEARRVFKVVANLATAREIIECQNTIGIAISSIDEGKQIPSDALHQIVKIYSQIFYKECADNNSEHRKNRSIIQSYMFNSSSNIAASSAHKSTKYGHTKRALLEISGHLAQLQGATKDYEEDTK